MNQFLDAATATGAKLLVYCEQWYHWVAKISTACNGISDESLRMLSVSEASGTVSGSRAESFFIFLIKSRTGLAENHEIEGLDASRKTRVTHRLEHDSARHWELHRCCYLRIRWRRLNHAHSYRICRIRLDLPTTIGARETYFPPSRGPSTPERSWSVERIPWEAGDAKTELLAPRQRGRQHGLG
jgi:hypothetical protein